MLEFDMQRNYSDSKEKKSEAILSNIEFNKNKAIKILKN